MASRIVDTWHHTDFTREKDSLSFLRFDRCIRGMNLFCVDRMHVSNLLGDRGDLVGILVGSCMSDHARVVLVDSLSLCVSVIVYKLMTA